MVYICGCGRYSFSSFCRPGLQGSPAIEHASAVYRMESYASHCLLFFGSLLFELLFRFALSRGSWVYVHWWGILDRLFLAAVCIVISSLITSLESHERAA